MSKNQQASVAPGAAGRAVFNHPATGFQICLLALLVMFCSGCFSVPITPKALAGGTDRLAERNSDLKRWTNAVLACNEFLKSPERKTLPPGRIEFGDQGMVFVSETNRLPIRVRWTDWGDLLIPFNMAAQERSDGFVVGLVPPGQLRLLDNSFFNSNDGKPSPSVVMASLILHELTHSYYHMGTVDFHHGLTYYMESIFLFRYRSHSQERLPFQTDAEFWAFFQRRMAEQQKNATGGRN